MAMLTSLKHLEIVDCRGICDTNSLIHLTCLAKLRIHNVGTGAISSIVSPYLLQLLEQNVQPCLEEEDEDDFGFVLFVVDEEDLQHGMWRN